MKSQYQSWRYEPVYLGEPQDGSRQSRFEAAFEASFSLSMKTSRSRISPLLQDADSLLVVFGGALWGLSNYFVLPLAIGRPRKRMHPSLDSERHAVCLEQDVASGFPRATQNHAAQR